MIDVIYQVQAGTTGACHKTFEEWYRHEGQRQRPQASKQAGLAEDGGHTVGHRNKIRWQALKCK